MRLVVTGKTGQVATALLERGPLQSADVITIGRPQLDLTRPGDFAAAIASTSPDIIVSAAAYTAVDQAETEIELAHAINGHAPGVIASTAHSLGIPLIHLSTDYVFDGTKAQPYLETDITGPVSIYGKSKLAGETSVRAATTDHVILRTAWVYSPFGRNFVKTMLRLADSHDSLGVVADQFGCPTSALDIADAVLTVAANLLGSPDDKLRGTFHMSGKGEASWAEFAEHIFAESARLGGATASVKRIGTVEYPTPAIRPANSRLNTDKLRAVHGVSLPHWRSSTDEVLRRLVIKATNL